MSNIAMVLVCRCVLLLSKLSYIRVMNPGKKRFTVCAFLQCKTIFRIVH